MRFSLTTGQTDGQRNFSTRITFFFAHGTLKQSLTDTDEQERRSKGGVSGQKLMALWSGIPHKEKCVTCMYVKMSSSSERPGNVPVLLMLRISMSDGDDFILCP